MLLVSQSDIFCGYAQADGRRKDGGAKTVPKGVRHGIICVDYSAGMGKLQTDKYVLDVFSVPNIQ